MPEEPRNPPEAQDANSSSPTTTNDTSTSTFTPQQVPFSLTPAHVLAAASVPLCIGTYYGFQRQLKIVEREARAAAKEDHVSIALTRESKSVARRALSLGTLLSVGSFGLVGAVAFYASGFQSFDEAITYLHAWGPRKRSQFEDFLGIDRKRHNDDIDVQATRNMTGDEELEYYRRTYFEDSSDDTRTTPQNSGQT